jgi:hypothetical protein
MDKNKALWGVLVLSVISSIGCYAYSQPAVSTCADTDAQNISIKGSVTTVSKKNLSTTLTDYCLDKVTVYEAYCTGTGARRYGSYKALKCPKNFACLDGACISASTTTTTTTTTSSTTTYPLVVLYGRVFVANKSIFVPDASVDIRCGGNISSIRNKTDSSGYFIISIPCPAGSLISVKASSGPLSICLRPNICMPFQGGWGKTYLNVSKAGYVKVNVPVSLETCIMPGDTPPCGTVDLQEIVDSIDDWENGTFSLTDVLTLISYYSGEQKVVLFRELPASSQPGDNFTVNLSMIVNPDYATPVVVGVMEQYPSGWSVTDINLNGMKKVYPDRIEWLFWTMGSPVQNQTLFYRITSPSNYSGTAAFNGEVNAGNSSIIHGDSTIYFP